MQTFRISEVIRYVAAGTLSVALNLLIITFLTEVLGLHYLLSISVCFVTVTFVSFYLNRSWTFRKRGDGVPRDLARYVFVTLTLLPLSLGFCSLLVEVIRLPYPLAVPLSSVVFVPVSFILHRGWSFGQRPQASATAREGQ